MNRKQRHEAARDRYEQSAGGGGAPNPILNDEDDNDFFAGFDKQSLSVVQPVDPTHLVAEIDALRASLRETQEQLAHEKEHRKAWESAGQKVMDDKNAAMQQWRERAEQAEATLAQLQRDYDNQPKYAASARQAIKRLEQATATHEALRQQVTALVEAVNAYEDSEDNFNTWEAPTLAGVLEQARKLAVLQAPAPASQEQKP